MNLKINEPLLYSTRQKIINVMQWSSHLNMNEEHTNNTFRN